MVEEFKEVDKIMLGRGVLANPALMNEILNNEFMDKKVLKEFHDERNVRQALDRVHFVRHL